MNTTKTIELSLKDLNEGKRKCLFINYKHLGIIHNILVSTGTLVIGDQTSSNL